MHYGLFIHYVPQLTLYADGTGADADVVEIASAFDAAGFADDVASMQVEYIIFTAWHAKMQPLYPSPVMDAYRPGRSAQRDLIGEMLDAVNAKGIPVFLYTHAYDGYEFTEEEKIATGWGKGVGPTDQQPNWDTFDYQKWNNFLNEVYAELLDQYGSRIAGLFFDEGSSDAIMDRANDFPRLRQTIYSRSPNLVSLQNMYGKLYGWDIGLKEYYGWGEFASSDGNTWPAYVIPVATIFSDTWWATRPLGSGQLRYSLESMFRYTVLQAGANLDGGGTAWAAGPYAGGGWETGVLPALQQLGNLIAQTAEAIKNTYPSTSYPTISGSTLNAIAWGVATRSTDDRYEYLHVLKPPAGNNLRLPAPEDGKIFGRAVVLKSGRPVTLEQTPSGVTLTLQAADTWDALDTVIKVAVIGVNPPAESYRYVNDTDPGITYVGSWKYSRWERMHGDYENDMHICTSDGGFFEYKFFGTGIEYIANTGGEMNAAEPLVAQVYFDGVYQTTLNGVPGPYRSQQVLFQIKNFPRGNHTLKVVKIKGSDLNLDALKVC